MIHTDDRLENPVTGEILIFRRTSHDTDGEAVLVETVVRPGGFVAAAHVHAHQTERFEVFDGQLGLQVGSDRLRAGPAVGSRRWRRRSPTQAGSSAGRRSRSGHHGRRTR